MRNITQTKGIVRRYLLQLNRKRDYTSPLNDPHLWSRNDKTTTAKDTEKGRELDVAVRGS